MGRPETDTLRAWWGRASSLTPWSLPPPPRPNTQRGSGLSSARRPAPPRSVAGGAWCGGGTGRGQGLIYTHTTTAGTYICRIICTHMYTQIHMHIIYAYVYVYNICRYTYNIFIFVSIFIYLYYIYAQVQEVHRHIHNNSRRGQGGWPPPPPQSKGEGLNPTHPPYITPGQG